jgi:hypothetical protein
MNIKDFAEKGFRAEDEAFQSGNFEPLKALEDPNVVYHYISSGDMVGHEGHKQQIIRSRQLHSDYKQEWQYLTGEGNLYAVSYKGSFRVTGQQPGSTIPAGKKALTNALVVLRVKKGRIVEGWINRSSTITD